MRPRLLETRLLRDANSLMKRLTMIYLSAYLLIGGLGLVTAPSLALRLLLSNRSYDDVMPRVAGAFMAALGGMILQFARAGDFRYYTSTIAARSFIVVVFGALLFKTGDPLFIVLSTIVLVGLLASVYAATRSL